MTDFCNRYCAAWPACPCGQDPGPPTAAGFATGDNGQRWEIRYRVAGETDHRTLGWSNDFDGAKKMAAAWRLHPDGHTTWIFDRGKARGPP